MSNAQDRQGLRIRLMVTGDLPEVDAVQRASYVPALHEDPALFRVLLAAGAGRCLVAEVAAGLAGYVFSYPVDPEQGSFESGPRPLSGDEDTLYIHDLCIHPAYRGLGVAQKLFAGLDVRARSSGLARIKALAVQNSQDFWRRMGFEVYGESRFRGEPAVVMMKFLSGIEGEHEHE